MLQRSHVLESTDVQAIQVVDRKEGKPVQSSTEVYSNGDGGGAGADIDIFCAAASGSGTSRITCRTLLVCKSDLERLNSCISPAFWCPHEVHRHIHDKSHEHSLNISICSVLAVQLVKDLIAQGQPVNT